jgi:hypothetical protein
MGILANRSQTSEVLSQAREILPEKKKSKKAKE